VGMRIGGVEFVRDDRDAIWMNMRETLRVPRQGFKWFEVTLVGDVPDPNTVTEDTLWIEHRIGNGPFEIIERGTVWVSDYVLKVTLPDTLADAEGFAAGDYQVSVDGMRSRRDVAIDGEPRQAWPTGNGKAGGKFVFKFELYG
jgi:hypothetical protein